MRDFEPRKPIVAVACKERLRGSVTGYRFYSARERLAGQNCSLSWTRRFMLQCSISSPYTNLTRTAGSEFNLRRRQARRSDRAQGGASAGPPSKTALEDDCHEREQPQVRRDKARRLTVRHAQDGNPADIASVRRERRRASQGELREDERRHGGSIQPHSEQLHDGYQRPRGVQRQAY